MDTKVKIIVVVFVAILILYAVHFIFTQMSNSKKKETFIVDDDDVEHYEDPTNNKTSTPTPTKDTSRDTSKDVPSKDVAKSDSSSYNVRVLLLDDIEELKVSDKDIKGKLMEYLFSSEVIEKVVSMSTSERKAFVQSKYDALKTGTSLENGTVSKDSNTDKKDQFADTAVSTDLTKTIYSKTTDALTSLKSVQNTLTDIQKSLDSINTDVASKSKDTPKENYREPELPKLPFIEGFENVRNYASIF